MRRQGISAIVLFAEQDICMRAVERFGEFVVPVVMYRLWELDDRDLGSEIERALDSGCRGIKFIAPYHPYSDERYHGLYRIVADRDAVATFHTGYINFPSQEPKFPPVEMLNMRAAHIDTISRYFPTLKIVMTHFSNPWWEEAWKVAYSRPNVYADLSGGTAILRSLDMWTQMFAPNGKLLTDSLKKLIFATDTRYLGADEHRFAPYIEFYQKLLDSLAAPKSLRNLVWCDTVRKLYALDR
jgi:predicted TIM-barrel fold metal-dependent hydrolase